MPAGAIYDVAWSMSGNRLAIAGSNCHVVVLDIRRPSANGIVNSL